MAKTTNVDNPDNKKKDKKPVGPKRTIFREFAEVAFYGLALLMFFRVFVFQNFQIPTASMENTLLIGDHITANTFVFKPSNRFEQKIMPFREIKRGDVIVFKWPQDIRQDWIKRCVGLPGDSFEIKQHRVLINGELLSEKYPFYKRDRGDDDRDRDNKYYPLGFNETKRGIENAEYLMQDDSRNVSADDLRRRTRSWLLTIYKNKGFDGKAYDNIIDRLNNSKPGTIPEGFYFMMGDNRNNSYDSRGWGLVPKEFVHGRAWFVWWSYGADVNGHKVEGANKIKKYAELIVTFWTRSRWSSSFELIK